MISQKLQREKKLFHQRVVPKQRQFVFTYNSKKAVKKSARKIVMVVFEESNKFHDHMLSRKAELYIKPTVADNNY